MRALFFLKLKTAPEIAVLSENSISPDTVILELNALTEDMLFLVKLHSLIFREES